MARTTGQRINTDIEVKVDERFKKMKLSHVDKWATFFVKQFQALPNFTDLSKNIQQIYQKKSPFLLKTDAKAPSTSRNTSSRQSTPRHLASMSSQPNSPLFPTDPVKERTRAPFPKGEVSLNRAKTLLNLTHLSRHHHMETVKTLSDFMANQLAGDQTLENAEPFYQTMSSRLIARKSTVHTHQEIDEVVSPKAPESPLLSPVLELPQKKRVNSMPQILPLEASGHKVKVVEGTENLFNLVELAKKESGALLATLRRQRKHIVGSIHSLMQGKRIQNQETETRNSKKVLARKLVPLKENEKTKFRRESYATFCRVKTLESIKGGQMKGPSSPGKTPLLSCDTSPMNSSSRLRLHMKFLSTNGNDTSRSSTKRFFPSDSITTRGVTSRLRSKGNIDEELKSKCQALVENINSLKRDFTEGKQLFDSKEIHTERENLEHLKVTIEAYSEYVPDTLRFSENERKQFDSDRLVMTSYRRKLKDH